MLVSALSLVSWEQSQAQTVFVDIFPSQDNPTSEPLWIFSGTSTTAVGSSIRTSTGSNSLGLGDDVRLAGNIYNANKPNNVNFSLSSLFSSSNTKDIKSVAARILSGGKTNITFAASATNTPTIGSGSRTIFHIFMDDNSSEDGMGIRVSGSSSFSYSGYQSSAWTGAGILDKPIGDFFTGTYNRASGIFDQAPYFWRLAQTRYRLSSTAKSSPNQRNTRLSSACLP